MKRKTPKRPGKAKAKSKEAGKVGRPATEFDIEQVESLAARGLTQEQIAAALGIAPSTLYVNKLRNEELAEACARGSAKGTLQIANAHFVAALAGNVSAMQFILRTKGGFSEVQRSELSGPNGAPLATPAVIIKWDKPPEQKK